MECLQMFLGLWPGLRDMGEAIEGIFSCWCL